MKRFGRLAEDTARFADMLAAMGSEQRLSIIRLLLGAHPEGMVVGSIQEQTGITASTLSHHLERLRHEGLVTVTREGTFLRYRADVDALRELLSFLYAECCRPEGTGPLVALATAPPNREGELQ
jgi:ArsR family transcriptional regulator